MAYAEKRGKLWRARWRGPDGTLESKPGFQTRKAAESYARDQEAAIRSNTFEMEWPPRSGRRIVAPECDRAAYFAAPEALVKILDYQRGFIEEAAGRLSGGGA